MGETAEVTYASLLDVSALRLHAKDQPDPSWGRQGIELIERLLWAGAQYLRDADTQSVDRGRFAEHRRVWLDLLTRYELYYSQSGIPGARQRGRSAGRQLELLAVTHSD